MIRGAGNGIGVGVPGVVRANYSGAIYGSLLAASVVVGSGAGSKFALSPLRLAALLLVTGFVFWFAHAYARLVGDRVDNTRLDAADVGRVARHEWPLLQASFLPAGTAVLFGLLGASNAAATWAALTAAIAAQIGWATVAAVRAGGSGPLIFVTALVNLALGLIIILLKAVLQH